MAASSGATPTSGAGSCDRCHCLRPTAFELAEQGAWPDFGQLQQYLGQRLDAMSRRWTKPTPPCATSGSPIRRGRPLLRSTWLKALHTDEISGGEEDTHRPNPAMTFGLFRAFGEAGLRGCFENPRDYLQRVLIG